MPNLQWHTCYVYIRYSYVKHSPFYQHPYRQIYEKRRYRWLHSRKVSHTQRTQTVSKWLMFYAPNSLWILNMMICRFVLNIYSLLFGYFLMAYFFQGTRLLVWLESFFKVRIDHNIFFVCSHVPWTPTESENILDLKKQKKKNMTRYLVSDSWPGFWHQVVCNARLALHSVAIPILYAIHVKPMSAAKYGEKSQSCRNT